jgi:DNA-3-methyladenine glycosylase II
VTQHRAGRAVPFGGTLPPKAMDGEAKSGYSIPVRVPYRLDLTVSVLRRLSTNLVDVLSPDGAYVRLLDDAGPAVVRVRQVDARTLDVGIDGDRREHRRLLAVVRRTLGVEVDLTRFYRSASRIQWLHPLALRMRGVKPPRYPTLWEAALVILPPQSPPARSFARMRSIARDGLSCLGQTSVQFMTVRQR